MHLAIFGDRFKRFDTLFEVLVDEQRIADDVFACFMYLDWAFGFR
jgi:hypothetical protein